MLKMGDYACVINFRIIIIIIIIIINATAAMKISVIRITIIV